MTLVLQGMMVFFVGSFLLLFCMLVTSPMRTALRLRVLMRHAASVDGQTPDGPVVLRAELKGPPDRRTPLGAAAAVYAIQVIESDGDSRSVICSFGEASGVSLKEGTAELSLAADAAQIGMSPIPTVQWLETELSRVGWSLEVPEAVRLRCGLKRHRNLRYSEARIESGTQVTVIGCRSDGKILACADGMDQVSRLSWHEIIERTAEHEFIAKVGFAVAVLVLWGTAFTLTATPRRLTHWMFRAKLAAAEQEEWKL